MKKTAQCSCGRFSAHTTGDPIAVVMCHCLECQKRTGSVLGVGAYFAPDHVKLEGEYKSFSRPCESGETFESKFCPHCGTTLCWKVIEEVDSRIGLAVGAFTDPCFPKPERSVWEQSRHPWVSVEMIRDHFLQGRS